MLSSKVPGKYSVTLRRVALYTVHTLSVSSELVWVRDHVLGQTSYHPNLTWTVVFRETGKSGWKTPGEVVEHEETDGKSPPFYAVLRFCCVTY